WTLPEPQAGTAGIRIFLVDDSLDFLKSASFFLSTDPRLQVVGQAQSGRDALDKLALTPCDLVLIDLHMPEMNGLETLRQLRGQSAAPRAILVTLHDVPEYRTLATTYGADGFVPKLEFGTRLLPMIHALFQQTA